MSPRVFRLPKSAYLAVLILALCVTVVVQQPLAALVYLLPAGAAIFIARTATVVSEDGITVRALIGHRTLRWADVRGLSVTGRSVYAVSADAAMRLPCVRVADLAAVATASGGHLPPVAEATPKYPPSRRSRRPSRQ
ncbi:MAG TPA: PH domain-containing protein [Jatrophihabitantaceae bacterium]